MKRKRNTEQERDGRGMGRIIIRGSQGRKEKVEDNKGKKNKERYKEN